MISCDPPLAILSPENALMKDLMQNYNRNIRPRVNPNEVMEIYATFVLKKIENLVRTTVLLKDLLKAYYTYSAKRQCNPRYYYTYTRDQR